MRHCRELVLAAAARAFEIDLVPDFAALRQRMPAVAREALEPRRVAGRDPALGHVARHHRPGADERHPSDLDSRQHDRSASDGGTVVHQALADRPVRFALGRTVGVDRPRVLVVEEHHARTEKHAVLEVETVEHEDAVLQLAEVADPHVLVDV